MTTGTYGLGTGSGGSTSVNESILSIGPGQKRQAMRQLGDAAEEEQKRNIKNNQIEAERQAGNSQLGGQLGGLAGGAAAGAMYGSSAGPWGTLIGGAVGAIAGKYF
jgi:predicted lipid-binding transport protein (Tim44 family)